MNIIEDFNNIPDGLHRETNEDNIITYHNGYEIRSCKCGKQFIVAKSVVIKRQTCGRKSCDRGVNG